MKEKVLNNKKNGMAMMLLFLLLYAVGVGAIAFGAVQEVIPVMVVGIVWAAIGWIPFVGLRVLKPQEALVLTLFGKYIGTLKENGFYWVNPFCSSVNPAAKTKLNQSGDVDGGSGKGSLASVLGASAKESSEVQITNNKISLKIMTLNNNRQKINDCLGNPIEIGIAVMWRVVDTAKAVFDVDNYKEYLSLQCDSALRNIVRIYPYDVAPNVDTTGDGIADEGSLRGSSEVVAERIRKEIQQKVEIAGLEIIEASHLFSIGVDNIDVVVHPQSIIHSMIRLKDGSVLAQMGKPNMMMPIEVALYYPRRGPGFMEKFDPFAQGANTLNFEKCDTKVFGLLELAYYAGRKKGLLPSVMNGANEVAVNAFLNGKIGYLDIERIVSGVMNEYEKTNSAYKAGSLEDILNADKEARMIASRIMETED